ncbi:hypothetical protein SDC9_79861 [bioreactor metagenome]|uniref:Uncharacterized protein n=1 Tax=bioreactor metagenome TaxID=1076179 RepID=A0A644YZN0_9ZZZZ
MGDGTRCPAAAFAGTARTPGMPRRRLPVNEASDPGHVQGTRGDLGPVVPRMRDTPDRVGRSIVLIVRVFRPEGWGGTLTGTAHPSGRRSTRRRTNCGGTKDPHQAEGL